MNLSTGKAKSPGRWSARKVSKRTHFTCRTSCHSDKRVKRVTRLSPASPVYLSPFQNYPSAGWLVGRKPLEYGCPDSPPGIPVVGFRDVLVKLIPRQNKHMLQFRWGFEVSFPAPHDDALRVLVDDRLHIIASLITCVLHFLLLLVLGLLRLQLLSVCLCGWMGDGDTTQHCLRVAVCIKHYFREYLALKPDFSEIRFIPGLCQF